MSESIAFGDRAITNVMVIALALTMLVSGLSIGFLLSQYYMAEQSQDAIAEELDLFGQHFWGGNNWTETAIVIINTGEKDVAINRVTVLGIECNWTNIYYWKTSNGSVSADLDSTSGNLSGTSHRIVIDGFERNFVQAIDKLTLPSFWTMILYIRGPEGIVPADVPQTVTITIFTEHEMYYRQATSEVTFTFTQTEQVTFTAYQWGPLGTTTVPYILITVKNTGATDLSIAEVRVDGVTASHNGTFPYLVTKGSSVTLNVTRTGAYTRGTQYSFMVITAKGNQFGPYVRTAP